MSRNSLSNIKTWDGLYDTLILDFTIPLPTGDGRGGVQDFEIVPNSGIIYLII